MTAAVFPRLYGKDVQIRVLPLAEQAAATFG